MTFFFTFANNSYFSTPLFRLAERNLYRLQSVEVLLKLIRFTLNTLSLNESFIKGYVWRRVASIQAFTSATTWKLTALVNFNVSHSRSRFKTDRGEITGFFFSKKD